jgi:prolyl-tRNA synthetase
MSTRLIGAVIMVHGDDSGLVLPPAIAPVEVMIIPIMQKKEGVLEKAEELRGRLAKNHRVKVDKTDKSPGWKFAEHEMKGVPVRVEIGPKDIEQNQCVLVRRDTREKLFVSLDQLEVEVAKLLEQMQKDLLAKATAHRDDHTSSATSMAEFSESLKAKPGFVKAMWCGDVACEEKVKEEVGASSRCMPFEQEMIAETCICCGKPATTMVYWGKAY